MLLSRCTKYENGQLEGAEEMAQWLKESFLVSKDRGSVPSTHVKWLTSTVSGSGRSDISSLHMCIFTHKHVILKSFQDKVANKIQSYLFFCHTKPYQRTFGKCNTCKKY